MATKYLDDTTLAYFWGRLKTYFVKQETGKGLSANDLTDALKKSYDGAVTNANKLVSGGAEANKINTIAVNGTVIDPDTSKKVSITMPTKVSDLANDSLFQTQSQVSSAIATAVGKITGISFSIVDTLPTTGTNGVIYLIAHSHSDSGDSYDEYAWIASASKYEKLGNTDVDLSGYMKTADMSAITTAEIDTMIG